MSTSKHIDKICIAAIALTLVITILFMNGGALGISLMASAMPYESSLFDTSYVHTIDIVMDDWDSFIEECEDEEYASCTVVVDGEKISNVAIRAKGNTSLSTVSTLNSDRYSFKLEFDHYESGKSLDGLDKLCLNNLIQDNTMMKDYIVYQLMNDFGVDSPLCSFAYLTVNGEDWGLYLAVEGIEDSFLSRNYGSETGELYKPDSMSFGGGRGNGKDFDFEDLDFEDFDFSEMADTASSEFASGEFASGEPEENAESRQDGDDPAGMSFPEQTEFSGEEIPSQTDTQTESGAQQAPAAAGAASFDASGAFGGMGSDDVKLQYIDDDPDSYSNIFDNAKTDISDDDKERLIQSLKNLSEYTDLENTVDTDEVIRYFVVHNFVCNGDSYTGSMIHNYYLYEEDGKLSMIPWDYNLAFGTFQGGNASDTVNTSIDDPVSGGTVDDRPMLGWIFSSEEYTGQYHELFAEFVEKWFTDGELETLIDETAEMIRPYVEKDPTAFCTAEEFETGVQALKSFVALRAEAVSAQLAGDESIIDTGDLNLSDMGSMNSAGGGMQMPGNISGTATMDMASFLLIIDGDGNEVDIGDLIPDTAEIVRVTMADASVLTLSELDMQSLMELDLSQLISAEDADGNIYDLSGYTISMSMPGFAGSSSAEAAPGMTENGQDETSSEKNASGEAETSGQKGASSEPGGFTASASSEFSAQTDGTTAETETEEQTRDGGNGSFEMPDGMQMPEGDFSDFTGEKGADNAPDGAALSGAGNTGNWILLAASVLILAVGLFVAAKKKY